MNIHSSSKAGRNLDRLLESASIEHQPVLIQGANASAVLVSAEDWSAIQGTLHLLSIPGMRESLREGMATPLSECSEEIDWSCGEAS